jgi:hypothetical protein
MVGPKRQATNNAGLPGAINAKAADQLGTCVLALMRSWYGVGHVAIRQDDRRLPRLNAVTKRHRLWSTSKMERCVATFAIAASLFAPVAQANDALEAKVRTYVPGARNSSARR